MEQHIVYVVPVVRFTHFIPTYSLTIQPITAIAMVNQQIKVWDQCNMRLYSAMATGSFNRTLIRSVLLYRILRILLVTFNFT
jgi:hypothetical protein